MSDVKRYITERAEHDHEFAVNFEEGYEDFKIGVILRQAREAAGLTQEEVAQKLQTQGPVQPIIYLRACQTLTQV